MAKNKKAKTPGTPSTPGVKNGGVLKAKNAKTPNVNQKKALENAAKVTPVKGQQETKKNNSPSKADKNKQRQKEQAVLRAKVKMNEAADENAKRKFALNLRSLYVRFKTKTFPEDENQIRNIHPKIVNVKFPRTAVKKVKVAEEGDKKEVKVTQYRYCFAEFASEADAEEAKQKLQAMEFMGGTLYVDYMGDKADNRVALAKYQGKQDDKASVNPTRLHVSPLDASVDDKTLKDAFEEHKPLSAVIKFKKKKNSQGGKIRKIFGFVQFSGPAEAKAAFDASSKLKVGGKPVTVIYAKQEKPRKQKKEKKENDKQNKAKENESKKKAAASKKRKIEEVDENQTSDKKKLKEEEEEVKSEDSSEAENDKEEIKSEESSEVENDKDEEEADEVKEEESASNEEEESEVENDAESDEDED